MNLLTKQPPVDGPAGVKVLEYVGRILLVAIFLFAAMGKFADTENMQVLLGSVGLPGFLIWPAAALDLGIAFAIIFGISWRIVASVAAAYCIALGFLFHLKPDSPNDMIHFAKNLTIAGGLVLLALRTR